MMKVKWLMLAVLGAAAVGFAVDEASTQPSDRRPVRPRDMREGMRGERPGPRGQQPWFPPLNEEETAKAEAFMRENMPNTYSVWEKVPDFVKRRMPFPPRLQAGFRMMFDAEQKGDTEMQELIEKQMKLRDELVGMRLSNPNGRPWLDEKMRAKIAEVAQANIRQRERRLERMKQQLKEEESRLEKERQNPQEMIERQVRSMWEESNWVKRVQEHQGAETRPSDDPATFPKSKD